MKIVIAIDSFKGSMTSMEAALAAKDGIMAIYKNCVPEDMPEIVMKPVADGGEGMTEALVEGMGGSYIDTIVTGPLGQKVTARYGILADGKTAVMEMASAAGITLAERKDPWNATTYGVGEMIIDAVNRGIRKFIMGIGGSATTDGGTGMLKALGIEFLDGCGNLIDDGICKLDRIADIHDVNMPDELAECRFEVACDVKNPLCGGNGAVYVYGPQKGVKLDERAVLDAKMAHYAKATAVFTGEDHSADEGAGAAGGLGFAFISYLPHAELKSGIKIALEAVDLEHEIKDADLVVTGEGKLDEQTAMGKVPVGIASVAKKYGKPVIAFAGCLGYGAEKCVAEGIDEFFTITPEYMSLEEAMDTETAKKNMKKAVERQLPGFISRWKKEGNRK